MHFLNSCVGMIPLKKRYMFEIFYGMLTFTIRFESLVCVCGRSEFHPEIHMPEATNRANLPQPNTISWPFLLCLSVLKMCAQFIFRNLFDKFISVCMLHICCASVRLDGRHCQSWQSLFGHI